MGGSLTAACYAVLLATAVWAVGGRPRTAAARLQLPLATVGTLLAVGTVSVLQLTLFPELLGDLQRNRQAITHGEVWRLVTALVVQDGGWPGTVFNLAALAVVGSVAEVRWGRRRWLGIALASGIGAQFWGLLVQPSGAGNSVLVFGLAASLHVLALRDGPRLARVPAVAGLVTGAVLLGAGDLHGGAAAIGAAGAAALLRSRAGAPDPAS
jgi:membrane associated rhomboid family serine protease